MFPRVLFIICLLAIVFLPVSPAAALAVGLVFGLSAGNPFAAASRKAIKYLLQLSIIGLGFGMDIHSVVQAGREGFVYTVMTIGVTMALGYLIGRWLKVDKKISYLLTCGTAICGGSAIAAVSQVIDADEKDISVSIAVVFILNAVALFVFPPAGNMLGMSQTDFGIWSAIAIHDTSSVAGAAAAYGDESLLTATTVKLARALWIIPLVLVTAAVFKKGSNAADYPWFVLIFILASVVNTWMPLPEAMSATIVSVAKKGFSLTLFLIGAGITYSRIKEAGARPLLQGFLLWVCITLISLYFVLNS